MNVVHIFHHLSTRKYLNIELFCRPELGQSCWIGGHDGVRGSCEAARGRDTSNGFWEGERDVEIGLRFHQRKEKR